MPDYGGGFHQKTVAGLAETQAPIHVFVAIWGICLVEQANLVKSLGPCQRGASRKPIDFGRLSDLSRFNFSGNGVLVQRERSRRRGPRPASEPEVVLQPQEIHAGELLCQTPERFIVRAIVGNQNSETRIVHSL